MEESKNGVETLLPKRAKEVLYNLVHLYTQTKSPISSKLLAQGFQPQASPATLRAIMASLEEAGLLFAPHTSAGRIPTPAGLKVVVSSTTYIQGTISAADKAILETPCTKTFQDLSSVFEEMADALAQLSGYTSIMLVPKMNAIITHLACIPLHHTRSLILLTTEGGWVETCTVHVPLSLKEENLPAAVEALVAKLRGCTLWEACMILEQEKYASPLHDILSWVQNTLKSFEKGNEVIIRGAKNLLQSIQDVETLQRISLLFDAFETHEGLMSLMDAIAQAEGVQLCIDPHVPLFSLTGCCAVMAPYGGKRGNTGGVGVLGPLHMDYKKVVPLVSYSASVIAHVLKI